jgi:multidrug efflux system membrane fusion protein
MLSGCLLTLCLLSATPVLASERSENAPQTLRAPDVVPSLPGIANARRRVTLTAPIEGALLEIRCAEGELVQQGAVLAVIDNRVAAAATRLAAAAAEHTGGIARAESELRAAQKLVARMTQAGERRAASELEIERAESAVEQAEALLSQAHEQQEAAQVALALEQAKLESYNIRAPFSGRVTRIRSEVGETLTMVKPVLELVDTSQLRVELYLPALCYARLEQGVNYALLASAPVDATLPARLVLKDHDIDTGTQTFRCVFEIDNADGDLPSGFTARLVAPRNEMPVSSGSAADE